jgi:NADPH:quinone reductase-like Zn-dependent oxidoreductase/malonyl CoA-acyl carrier protein transacylase
MINSLTVCHVDELMKDRKSSRINEAEISQPLCSALQIALVDLYASWNIHPIRVIGHSSGEVAAAYATGALDLESAMRIAFFRGLLSGKMRTLGYKGGMMAAGLSERDALEEIESLGNEYGKAVVACVNSPQSVTLSGDLAAIKQLQQVLTSRGIFARKLEVEIAYHSHHMLALADEYRLCMTNLRVVPWEKRNDITMFSSVTGRAIAPEDDLGADYWVDNMVSCVRFSDALMDLCKEKGLDMNMYKVDILVEIGPHAALAGPVKQTLASLKEHDQNDTIAIPIRYLSTLVRGVDAVVTSLTVAGSLCTQGYSVDLHQANFPRSSPELSLSVLTDLPTYSWNHERKFWSESRLSHDYRFRPFPRTDLLGAPVNDWNPMQPRWRNFIRLAEQPWVRSHVVQGAIVYPAAGFCCMALEAALQLNTMTSKADKPGLNERLIAEYNIRSLDISRALVVPETEDGVEVMFSMLSNPTNSVTLWDHENEFRIFSYTTSDGWAEHCRGFVSVFYQGDNQLSAGLETEHDFKIQEAQNACQTNIPINEFYTSLNSVGLYYGPEFQGVVEISTGHGHALGTVQVTDTASEMPKRFQFEHLIHPATLDTFLQVSIAALSDGDIENLTQAFVPTKIEEIRVSGDISLLTGHKLQVAAETGSRSLREVHTSVMAVAGDGLVVQMQNITLSAIASFETRDDPDIPNHTAIAVWEPDVDLLSTEKMNQVLQASLNSGRPRPKDFELLAYYYFDRVLNEINANEMSHMHSHHQKFFRYMQHQRDLVLSDKHEQQDKDWKQLSTPHVQARLERLIDDFSDKSNYEGRMFVRMGEALTSVLRKEVEPLALMMEDNLLHDYYTVALGMDGTYPQIARYISLLSHKYPDLDYLEIGAGTGGCTVPVLQALSGTDNHKYPRMKSYTYTDISSGFFEQAAEKFSSWGDMIQYAKLDIEQDPQTQAGFENRRFDVIIAANVLHATFDMNQTIRHARKLLREGGKLVLLDMTHSMLCVSLIFGNLPGWWNCSEPWREYGPLLSEDQWREVFLNNHFTDFEASSPDLLNPLEEQTRVMISTATGSDTINGNKTLSRALILTPDTTSTEGEMVTAMSSRLNDVGISTDLCTLRESQGLNLDGTAIISFVELDKPLLAEISARELTALQHIIQASVGLVWVTRGGTATKGTRPELSMFQGMARSLRAERENVPCVTVDLDAEQPLSGSEASGLLLDVFMQSFGLASRHCIGVVDREFSEERGMLKIKRAIENPRLNQLIASRTNSIPLRPELQDVWESSRPLQVKIRSVGMLDSLAFHDGSVTPHQLPEDHVEIEVRAVGLNSRDVQTCLGEVSDDDGVLGHECAGVITQTGSTVQHVAVGDRVLAWGRGLLSTVVQTPGRFVQKIPSTMSYAAAAAFPLAYVTAYYSLVHVACLQSGDTVLISNAASSVGRAAMHIARLYGAEVFVTVGSEEMKRDLIEAYTICENHVFNVSSERDVAFVDRILRATKGRGVDIVFNDLVGKAFQATYKVVAPFGRFLEIGNNDNALANRLELSKNTTFTRIDVFDLFLHNSKLAANIFSTASRLALEEYVQGSSPLSVRPFSKAQDSIRLIKDRKQEGKIVLEPLPGDLVQVSTS